MSMARNNLSVGISTSACNAGQPAPASQARPLDRGPLAGGFATIGVCGL